MIDRPDNNIGVPHAASGGGATIVGLVVAAIVFLALLLVFGGALFSGGTLIDSDLKVTKETKPK